MPRFTFMRIVLVLVWLAATLAYADALEDAAQELAAQIAGHLGAQERAQFITHNISSLPAVDASRARRMIEAALPKHPRAKSVVEITLTFSENAAGYLWVAEIHKGEVEMVAVRPKRAPSLPDRQLLTKRLLWQQSEPLLDVWQQDDTILLLSPTNLAIMEAGQRSEIAIEVPRVRDPRGHIDVEGNRVTAYFPDATCSGTFKPLQLVCENKPSDFSLNGTKVHFTPGRNTLDGIRPSDENVSACAGLSLTALKENKVELLGKNRAHLDEVDLAGTVTALWPANDGARVVVHNLNTEQYAAYALSVDCSSR